MKLAVGYPLLVDDTDEPFIRVVERFREDVGEVYFSWPGDPSARSVIGNRNGQPDWQVQERLENDLAAFGKMGIKLDLLFNANCGGGSAISRRLANHVCSVIDRVREAAGLDVVTTTSPFIAHVVKQRYGNLEIRASVNMRIGTVEALAYVEDQFDSFYIQREYNRDFERIEQLQEWAKDRGKKLLLLANSGCLRFCSTQTFHDNMVAHEQQISRTDNVPCEVLACRNYLRNSDNWAAILQSTWIRPEDLDRYEGCFPLIKLATRMHHNPAMVIQAYSRRRYQGNLLDLLEPGHGSLLQGFVIDNCRFPQDWFDRVTECSKQCHRCGYCREVLKEVLVDAEMEVARM